MFWLQRRRYYENTFEKSTHTKLFHRLHILWQLLYMMPYLILLPRVAQSIVGVIIYCCPNSNINYYSYQIFKFLYYIIPYYTLLYPIISYYILLYSLQASRQSNPTHDHLILTPPSPKLESIPYDLSYHISIILYYILNIYFLKKQMKTKIISIFSINRMMILIPIFGQHNLIITSHPLWFF